jgi:UDP-N-acetylmuramyl pentapeptide phosphotransferase/UDP-N-acetylglucosamine-1-phosphate transferase
MVAQSKKKDGEMVERDAHFASVPTCGVMAIIFVLIGSTVRTLLTSNPDPSRKSVKEASAMHIRHPCEQSAKNEPFQPA